METGVYKNKLQNFAEDFECEKTIVRIGGEYRVYDARQDALLKTFSPQALEYLLKDGRPFDTLQSKWIKFRELVTDYFTGEYTETQNEDFQEIYNDFFREWFGGEVWVGYSEDLLEMEVKSWKKRPEINPQKSRGDNPFRLYQLVRKRSPSVWIMKSVFTQIEYAINIENYPLVWASCNNGRNYRDWSELLKEFVALEQGFIVTQKLTIKRIQREVKNQSTLSKENQSLSCISPLFEVEVTDPAKKNKYEPFRACEPDIPKGIWDNTVNWFLTRAGGLGFVQNMNDKKERLTTGENFKDLHGVTNIQYRNLKNLNEFGKRMGRAYPGQELNFNLSNWGHAEGIPMGTFVGEEIDNDEQNDEPPSYSYKAKKK